MELKNLLKKLKAIKIIETKDYKYPIIENKALRGGLTNSIQRYSVYYLFPLLNEDSTLKYDAKVSVEHFIEKEGIENQRPSSLRFNNEIFLKEFIMELVRALAFFEKNLHKSISINSEHGTIFYNSRIMSLLEDIHKNYKEVLLKEK